MFFPFENELIFETPPEGLPVEGGRSSACLQRTRKEALEII
jgi:hypothetical protein